MKVAPSQPTETGVTTPAAKTLMQAVIHEIALAQMHTDLIVLENIINTQVPELLKQYTSNDIKQSVQATSPLKITTIKPGEAGYANYCNAKRTEVLAKFTLVLETDGRLGAVLHSNGQVGLTTYFDPYIQDPALTAALKTFDPFSL